MLTGYLHRIIKLYHVYYINPRARGAVPYPLWVEGRPPRGEKRQRRFLPRFFKRGSLINTLYLLLCTFYP
jgi:hypothetical protein